MLNKANIRFAKKELVWRTYSIAKALPTIQKIKIIDENEFAAVALNDKNETFVLYMATTSRQVPLNIYLFWQV